MNEIIKIEHHKKGFQLMLKANIPTISNKASMVNICLVAMYLYEIISDLHQNLLSGLRLSIYDLSYIWGRYIVKTEKDIHIFQYAYHTIKHAHI